MSSTLNGLRILNTRPHGKGKVLSQQITEAGGISIECPTIKIKARDSQWINELPALSQVDMALFVSAHAVHYCFQGLEAHQVQWPCSISTVAIGLGTAQALEQHRIHVYHIPSTPDSEGLLALPCLQQIKEQRVLLFKGVGGRELIEKTLQNRGARLRVVRVYERVMPRISPQLLNSLWRRDAVDIILLTCEESIGNLFKLFGEEAYPWLLNKPCLVLSQRLASIAAAIGIKKITLYHPNRIINTLLDYKDTIHGEQ